MLQVDVLNQLIDQRLIYLYMLNSKYRISDDELKAAIDKLRLESCRNGQQNDSRKEFAERRPNDGSVKNSFSARVELEKIISMKNSRATM